MGTLVIGMSLILLLLLDAAPAGAALQWEPIGPIAQPNGMTSVATDPSDPNVVWLAGGTSVWVTDDAGDTWALVLQLTRTALTGRDSEESAADLLELAEEDAEDADEDAEGDVEDFEDYYDDDGESSLDLLDEDGVAEDVTDEAFDDSATPTDGGSADSGQDDDELEALSDAASSGGSSGGILRMRVVGQRVYICTSRGLWTVDRAA